MYQVKKYNDKNWAVYDSNGKLVCVTVYKKGAEEVKRLLDSKPANALYTQANVAD